MVNPTAPRGDRTEPQRSFAHARVKVQWAEQHVKVAGSVIAWFIEEQKKAGVIVTNPDTGQCAIGGQAVPANVALAAGDAIFSLRSALDCCWMGLKRAVDAEAAKSTLPRGITRKEVERVLEKASVNVPFEGADLLILDKIRPYKEGNETLWLAGQLDNWNKHNMLITSLHSTRPVRLVVRNKVTGGIAVFEGCNFVGENLVYLGVGPFEIEGNADVPMDVVLVSRKPEDKRLLMPFLTSLLKDTHEAVELFAATFGERRQD